MHTNERPCEGEKRQRCASRGEAQGEPARLTPCYCASGLQSCENINSCCLCPQSVVLCYGKSRQTHTASTSPLPLAGQTGWALLRTQLLRLPVTSRRPLPQPVTHCCRYCLTVQLPKPSLFSRPRPGSPLYAWPCFYYQ